jgi:UDP-galactopyranose mutase
MMYDFLIVGCGFAGAVLAERLANAGNKKVLIIDKRNHIAGNAYDFYDEHGILVHKYGPHIFHTNSKDVFEYLGNFTDWRPYEHHVLASVEGQLVPMPINLNTINELFGLNLSSSGFEEFLASKAEKISPILTSEDVVLSTVGKDLYKMFFKGYTLKQWGMDPSELDASVTARVPTRTNKDNRYFTATYQAMPAGGYTRMFANMLSHPDIHIMLNTDFEDVKSMIPAKEIIYTGPIDAFFNYRFGKLPYRSIHFDFQTLDQEEYQPCGTVNYPMNHLYTRITEFKKLTGQVNPKTTIVFEYPTDCGDPYYPVPRKENKALYNQYKQLADTLPHVYFTGRLGTYKYYNMDQIVAQSLALFKTIMKAGKSSSNGIMERTISAKEDTI